MKVRNILIILAVLAAIGYLAYDAQTIGAAIGDGISWVRDQINDAKHH